MYGLSPVATSSKVLEYQGKSGFFQPEYGFKLPQSLVQRLRGDVDIAVHGRLDAGVAQQLLQNFRLHAALDGSCGVGVAQGVHAEVLDARLITEPV